MDENQQIITAYSNSFSKEKFFLKGNLNSQKKHTSTLKTWMANFFF